MPHSGPVSEQVQGKAKNAATCSCTDSWKITGRIILVKNVTNFSKSNILNVLALNDITASRDRKRNMVPAKEGIYGIFLLFFMIILYGAMMGLQVPSWSVRCDILELFLQITPSHPE